MPHATLHFDEVELLISAYGEVLGIDHVTRRVASWLSIAWRQQNTPFTAISWDIQAHEIPGSNGKQEIRAMGKAFVAIKRLRRLTHTNPAP